MIKTKDITYVGTLKSRFDNNSVIIAVDDKSYRMKVEDLLTIINHCDVPLEEYTPKIHTYLKPLWPQK